MMRQARDAQRVEQMFIRHSDCCCSECLKPVIIKLLRAERSAMRRVIRQRRTFYFGQHLKWLATVGNRPLVESFKLRADLCDDLLAALRRRR